MQTRRKAQCISRGYSEALQATSYSSSATRPSLSDWDFSRLSDELLAHILSYVVWSRVGPLELGPQARTPLWYGPLGLAVVRRIKVLRLVCKAFDRVVRTKTESLLVLGRNVLQRAVPYTDETWAQILEALETHPWANVVALMLRDFHDRNTVNAWQPLNEPVIMDMAHTTLVYLDLTGSKSLPASSPVLPERRRSAHMNKCFHISQGVLTGPCIDVSCLESAPVLATVILSYRRVKGATKMLQAPNLKDVEMKFSTVVEADIPAPRDAISHIEVLNMEFSSIDSLLFLPACPFLETATFNYCTRLLSLDGLLCENLVKLKLNHAAVSNIEPLQHCKLLEKLQMKQDPQLCGPIISLAPLSHCNNLHTLILPYSNVPDLSPLSTLPSLTRLDLFLASTANENALSSCASLKEIILADSTPGYSQIKTGEWMKLQLERPDLKIVLQGTDTHLT